jgi:rifampicin phosphotransferase
MSTGDGLTTLPSNGTDASNWRSLDDIDQRAVEHAGGKAAALAGVRNAGIATMPGIVLTTNVSDEYDRSGQLPDLADAFEQARRLAEGRPLVVRSSSVVEDSSTSSAAGQFETVLDVHDHDSFVAAVTEVLDSREAAGAADQPIAVLVQPMVHPELAGVCFGVDPVTGRSDHVVIAAVRGLPDPLVSGEVDGSRYVVERDGGVVDTTVADDVTLDDALITRLLDVEHRLAELFDGPQDVEWAVVDNELVVFQSRPVTTDIAGVPGGPVFGPGPVAETFPERLSRLESELWVEPLRHAVGDALRVAGTTPQRDIERSELVVVVDGWVAIDLEITGEIDVERSLGAKLSVARRIRALRSAWRVGRLRATLPDLGHRLADRVDVDLEQVPTMEHLTSRQLVALLDRTRTALRSLHAHEILMGLLTERADTTFNGASVALRVLAESRLDGFSDDDIIARSPVVLALCPPRIGPTVELPPEATASDFVDVPDLAETQVVRESLRLRVRWLQEVSARAAWALGTRLEDFGRLESAESVRHLSLDDLASAVSHRSVIADDAIAAARRAFDDDTAPLPSRFRLTDRRRPVAVAGAAAGGGTGAGGGIVEGIVTHDTDDFDDGAILVVSTLAPGLGPKLARVGGIVAETGSVLSHLAILAREQSVPTVVGHTGALERLPEGSRVRVDGASGAVERLDGDGDRNDEGVSA